MINLIIDLDLIIFLKKKLDTFFNNNDLRKLVSILKHILLIIV